MGMSTTKVFKAADRGSWRLLELRGRPLRTILLNVVVLRLAGMTQAGLLHVPVCKYVCSSVRPRGVMSCQAGMGAVLRIYGAAGCILEWRGLRRQCLFEAVSEHVRACAERAPYRHLPVRGVLIGRGFTDQGSGCGSRSNVWGCWCSPELERAWITRPFGMYRTQRDTAQKVWQCYVAYSRPGLGASELESFV